MDWYHPFAALGEEIGMQLVRPIPPEAVQHAASEGVKKFMSPGDPRLVALSESSEAEQWRERVFLLGIKPVIGGTPLEKAAAAVGWRFLVKDSSGEFAASYVTEPPPGGKPRLASVSHGQETGTLLRCVPRNRGYCAGLHRDRAVSASYANHSLPADRSFLARAGERRERVHRTFHLHDSGIREHAGPACREVPGDLQAARGGPAGGRRRTYAPRLDNVMDGRRNEKLVGGAPAVRCPTECTSE